MKKNEFVKQVVVNRKIEEGGFVLRMEEDSLQEIMDPSLDFILIFNIVS